MNSGSFDEFGDTLQKTNLLLKEIEADFGWENRRNQSYAALRAVLQTLRDRLTVEEAVQLGAQLPMLVRGMYYEEWEVSQVPKRVDREQFIQEIRKKFPFSMEESIEELISSVLVALRKYISAGEAQDIVSLLPKDIASMMGEFLESSKKKTLREEKEVIDAEGLGV